MKAEAVVGVVLVATVHVYNTIIVLQLCLYHVT